MHGLARVAVAVVLTLAGGEEALGSSLVLCSPIAGRLVTQDGTPVPGVGILRRWEWGWTGKTGSDSTITDADGRFSFDSVTGHSLTARIAPHEPSIRTEILAETGEGLRLLLSLNKGTYTLGSEASGVGQAGPALSVSCRIDAEPSDRGIYWGTCTAGD